MFSELNANRVFACFQLNNSDYRRRLEGAGRRVRVLADICPAYPPPNENRGRAGT